MSKQTSYMPLQHFVGHRGEGTGARRNGFTVIELLTVVALMALMASLSLPSLFGILNGQRQQQNLIRMGQILEQAQIAAQMRNTYVWVGIASTDASGAPLKMNGASVTLVTVVYGLTGSSGDLAGAAQVPNATAAFLLPPQVFYNAACPPTAGGSPILASQINQLKGSNVPDVSASSGIFATSLDSSASTSLNIAFSQKWVGQQITFRNVIQFNATGQPMVNSTLSNWIELPLGPSAGATVANSSGLLLSGLTGKITLIP